MIDKATYDGIASRLEHDLRQGARVDWHVSRYDAMLGVACISEETAKDIGTTPDAHFELTYKQMEIMLNVLIGVEVLWVKTYIARALVEDALVNYADIIRQLAAEEIAQKLVEQGIV